MWLKKRHPRGVNRAAFGLLACMIIPSELAFSEVNKDAQVSIWTVQEKQQLLSMSAHHLPKVGEDLSNQYQNNQQYPYHKEVLA